MSTAPQSDHDAAALARFDVFLSHHSADKPAIERIARALQRRGLVPWLDVWELTPGGDWQAELAAGLRASRACAVFVGPQGAGAWSAMEARMALDLAAKDPSFRVFPVLCPGVPEPFDPATLPPFLAAYSWVDLRAGTENEAALERLVCAIRGLSMPSMPPLSPPAAAGSPSGIPPGNLPAALSSFIGRERERQEVVVLLGRTRLVTLTGAGGVGKTRLSLAVAEEVRGRYRDGAWFVELAPLADPALVPGAVAQALGVREEPGRPILDTLAGYFKGRRTLLALDNCEHLVAACAELAATLLRATPDLRILATSREALEVPGEQLYQVPSLATPDPAHLPGLATIAGFEAVRLFVARAQARRADFALIVANAPAVAEICARLDGMPLAIELAAARVASMSVEAVATRLDDRFRLLTGGPRTALPRQQTLRATLDWSWDLLSKRERILLRRLCVFAGGCTLEAAETVCAGDSLEAWEVLDLLVGLVGKSLVQSDEAVGGEARYRLLETVRAFARERLSEAGEAKELAAAHATYYLDLAELVASHENRPDWSIWLERMSLAIDNMRAGLDHYISLRDAEPALRLAAAIGIYWHFRGGAEEGRERLVTALSLPETGSLRLCRAKALAALAQLSFDLTDYAAMTPYAREASDLYRSVGDLARASWSLWWLGISRNQVGDYAGARSAYDEQLALARQAGDPAALALALVYLADTAIDQEDVTAATAFLAEGLPLARQIGGVPQLLHDLWNEGRLATLVGDVAKAEASYREGLALARRNAEPSYITFNSYGLGYLASCRGDPASARRQLAEGLTLARDRNRPQGIHYGLDHAAVLAVATGQHDRAARLAGACTALRQPFHSIRHPIWKTLLARAGVPIERPAADPDLARAWDEGKAMTLEEAIAYALDDAAGH